MGQPTAQPPVFNEPNLDCCLTFYSTAKFVDEMSMNHQLRKGRR